MPNFIHKAILIGFLSLLPIMATAQDQVCKPDSIPATTPTNQFTDNGDGTVTDNKSGLMWKKCAEGQTESDCGGGSAQKYSWKGVLERAQAVNTAEGGFAGYVDWRVPNIKELASIVEEQCYIPTINLEIFPNAPFVWSWSSSPVAFNGYSAWGVNFYYGDVDYDDKFTLNGGSVRLVRNIQ